VVPPTAHPLIGREVELDALRELFETPDELPRAAVLSGPAGIGKTALWLAGIEAAGERGVLVLSSRPAESETALSYAGMTDMLGGAVGAVLPDLPPIQRRALEAALLLGEPGHQADARAVAAAFLAAVRLLAAERPICLAIDDLQWLDAASTAALRFSLTRLAGERVLLLLAVRGAPPEWLRRSLPDTGPGQIEIGGLSIGATYELLRDRLGAMFPRPTLLRLWETSAGNPFFALELGRALQRRGGTLALGEALPIPAALGELLQNRLDELAPSELEVAAFVALLATPTVTLVEAAVGQEAGACLNEALAAKIVELDDERVRFTHPLLGTAVTARLTPARRRSLHARLAEITPNKEEGAHHLARATAEPDESVARFLEEASRVARARGAPREAAELAAEAHRLTPAACRESASRLLNAARLHHEAGDSVRALEFLEQARAESTPGAGRAAALLQLAELRYDLAGPQELLQMLEEALHEAGSDHALAAEAHHTAAMCLRLTGPLAKGLDHANAALRALSDRSHPADECRALATYGLLHFDAGLGVPRKEMERALDLERSLPRPRHLLAAQVHAHHLSWSGEHALARATYLGIVSEWAHLPDQLDPLFQLAGLEWRVGDWEASTRYADRAIEIVRESGRDDMEPVLELPRAAVAAHLGRLDDARLACERGLGRTTGSLAAQSSYSQLLGFIELSTDEHSRALAHLKRTAALRDDLGLTEPGMRLELGDLLEALIATGELAEAEAILEDWEPRARSLDRAWALAVLGRCRGLELAARGDLEGAFASLERALAEHARITDPFQHARTLLAFGKTQRRAKKRGVARTTLEDALTRFERLGVPLWAEQTRAELARIGGRTRSDDLTEAERRIAALVGEGHTNREVAASLFLTVRSVETALTRIYRKLEVRSRAELAHRLRAKS